MASSDILSQTLTSITSIKLTELQNQRHLYEHGKKELLAKVANEATQRGKLSVLLKDIEKLAVMGKLDGNRSLSLYNARKFLGQASRDPSVTDKHLHDWQVKLEKELDIHSLKYEYADLYGRLVTEWLSASKGGTDTSAESSGFEQIGRKEMHEQRQTWEQYVFKASATNSTEIRTQLETLFTATKDSTNAYEILRTETRNFEDSMADEKTHFTVTSLKDLIQGLLRSDLVSDEKSKILRDFLANTVVLAEIADVLNMRISSLDKWSWDPKGTWVEQRRMLNGRYRFYHDEDLLQTILLRYIGLRWSVHFKSAFTIFQTFTGVWKPSSQPVPKVDRQRRDFFLGKGFRESVETHRARFFDDEVFLEQLSDDMDEQRGGYDDDNEHSSDTRKSGQQITQTTLQTLATEIIMKTRLGEDITVVRSDLKWFGPSLPHSTMFAVLSHFGVSDWWVDFFRRALEAPMKFVEDGTDAPVQIRKRGTPISGPLSDMLGESVLFCLDFAFNQQTGGARLYRLHDDIWFWGSETSCVKGWKTVTSFIDMMGLELNSEKTGSVKITRKGPVSKPHSSLPKGDVRWGFLKLDAATGRFLIDQENVEKHTEELRRQLNACKSIFDWIQAFNVYGCRFFTTNTGKPANCYGRAHIDQMLDMFNFIQDKLFAETGGSVTATLKNMITERFGVEEIPEGYLYIGSDYGGLDLKSPFVNLYLLRDLSNPDPYRKMEAFFDSEEKAYNDAKRRYEDGGVYDRSDLSYEVKDKLRGSDFMSFEEYTRHREQTSSQLLAVYTDLLRDPGEQTVLQTADVKSLIDATKFNQMSDYQKWIVQLYGPELIARFGDLNIVDRGLLPTGMVGMFRESRFKWQG